MGGILLFLKPAAGPAERDPVGRPDRAPRKLWSRIPPRLLGEAQETAALRHQAEPPRRPQCREFAASISSAISGIFSRPNKPIAAGINSCANDLTAARPMIRLSADNGRIRRYIACRGSRIHPREDWRVDCPAAIEAATFVRWPTDGTSSHSAFHVIERKDHATGEGLPFDPTGSGGQRRGFPTQQLVVQTGGR
jgi:hypothetical protein